MAEVNGIDIQHEIENINKMREWMGWEPLSPKEEENLWRKMEGLEPGEDAAFFIPAVVSEDHIVRSDT